MVFLEKIRKDKKRLVRSILVFLNVFVFLSIIMFLKPAITGNAITSVLITNSSVLENSESEMQEVEIISEVFEEDIEIKESFEIINKLNFIEIKDIINEGDKLNISYVFDNSDFIGQETTVEIWIVNNEIEVNRFYDVFLINRESEIIRNILINIPKEVNSGSLDVYFALSSDLNDFVKTIVFLDKVVLTGDVIGDTPKSKKSIYIIFLVVVGVVVVFIFLRTRREYSGKFKNNSVNKKMLRKRTIKLFY